MIIKIFGGLSEGKSTLARYLEQVLSQKNIQVSIEGEDQELTDEVLERNLQVISDSQDLKVTIKTIPYERETLPQYALDFNKKL